MLRVRQVIVALTFVLSVSALKAQGPELVDIRLTQPPPNQLRIADLWKVELNNRSGRPVRVTLHGTAEETSIPDGIIADATTRVITLQPGRTIVTGNDVQPIRVDQSNNKYRDALLRTGSVPSGEYLICCEVISEETDQVLGRDCKICIVERLTIPILIAPPDESEVTEKLPVFSWLSGSPPPVGFRPMFRLKIVEMFSNQTAYSAMRSNPAWFIRDGINANVFLYPISSRAFELQRKYAWQITLFDAADGRVPLGESEIWWFTYGTDAVEEDTSDQAGDDRRPDGSDTSGGGGVKSSRTDLTTDAQCPGENWDFELGTLGCWTIDGEAFLDDPVLEDHPVLGALGHHAKYWATSLGPTTGESAIGTMLSEEFQIKNSTIGFLCGGMLFGAAGVELLVEKLEKDTFSFPTRKLAASSKVFYIARTTSEDVGGRTETSRGGASDRLIPVDWNVTPFLNRTAYILVIDSTKVGHVNVDYFRFYDREKDDSVKLPVLVMAAGENHSLAATPQEKPKKNIRDMLASDVSVYKGGGVMLSDVNIVNDVSTTTKRFTSDIVDKNLKLNPSFAGTVNAEDFPKFSDQNTQGGGRNDGPDLYEMNASEASKIGKAGLNLSAFNPKNIVWGWGDNLRRAVGKDYSSVVPEPMKLEKVKEVKALAGGMDHSFAALKTGSVLAWGFNDYWQLGTDDRVQKNDPVDLKVADIIQVATGSRHSLALNSKGQVYVWGYNRTWECGTWLNVLTDGTTGQITQSLHLPKPSLHFALNGITAIAAGHSHSVALTFTGAVLAWGANNYGQCGVDPEDLFAVGWPTPVIIGSPSNTPPKSTFAAAPRTGCVAISAGDYHTVALMSDGTVMTWGGNASGQLGDGTNKDRPTPGKVKGLTNIRSIAAGSTFSLALDSAGNLWAWGNNALGQLGDGTRVGRTEPVKVSRLDAVSGVVAGGAHGMAVRADGGLWTWGTNEYGQLGEGPITNLTPVPLDPPLGPFRVEKLASP